MIQYQEFDYDLKSCRRCQSILKSKKVDPGVSDEGVLPRPIVSGIRKKPIMLIGQAPGLREYQTGTSFHGQSGQGIRKVFEDIGISDFDEYVWTSAVGKCYPGRKLVKREGSSRWLNSPENMALFLEAQELLTKEIAVWANVTDR